jgi:hypothetical protein
MQTSNLSSIRHVDSMPKMPALWPPNRPLHTQTPNSLRSMCPGTLDSRPPMQISGLPSEARCHHPQTKCAACQGLHRVSDQNCPKRARAVERAKQIRPFGPNMNHPEPHLSRPTSSLGSIEVVHTQLNKNKEDHESISDLEMDDAD